MGIVDTLVAASAVPGRLDHTTLDDTTLVDLDFADDLSLQTHSQLQISKIRPQHWQLPLHK